MSLINFIGPSYNLREVSVDCQKTINMYCVNDELQTGKSNLFLNGTPGLKQFLKIRNTNDNEEIRGMFVDSKDNLYIVCGYQLVQIIKNVNNNTYDQIVLGNLSTNTGYVSMAENGFQLALVDGDNYYLYIYETKTFSQYNPEGWLGSNTVTYFSTYFLFVERNSQKFFISKQYDGTTIEALDFASAESQPDDLVASISVNQYLWAIGTKTIDMFYNSGNSQFPISPMDSGSMQIGCVAPFSIALLGNNPIWLGRDGNGVGTIYMGSSNSNNAERISNYAVEYFIQNTENIKDAIAYTYQQEGHSFYVINFPSAGTTWCWDMATNMWHERQYLNPYNGNTERHRGQIHVFWDRKHLVSDYSKNLVYSMDLDYYTDNGDPIQRIRRGPHQFDNENLNIVKFNEFLLDLDVGSKYNNENRNALINLRYSNDGGKTWSNYLECPLWKDGELTYRIKWARLGSSRSRVWEVSTSDPVKTTWLNAYVISSVGRA